MKAKQATPARVRCGQGDEVVCVFIREIVLQGKSAEVNLFFVVLFKHKIVDLIDVGKEKPNSFFMQLQIM